MHSIQKCSDAPREVLRKYGTLIGKYPGLGCLFSFCVIAGLGIAGVVIRVKSGDDIINQKTMEEMWTTKGGTQEYEIRTAMDKHLKAQPKKNSQKVISMSVTGKGEWQDGDVMRPEAFADLFELYRAYFEAEVTTSFNTTWNIWELCYRGSVPDQPGAPIMPCLNLTPFDCFSENIVTTHPSWQGMDYYFASTPDGAPWPLAIYSNRVSMYDLDTAELKDHLRHGCKWWLDFVVWTPENWGGVVSWDNSSGPGLETINWGKQQLYTFVYDKPKNAQSRLKLTKNASDNFVDDFNEAVDLHVAKYVEAAEDFNRLNRVLRVNPIIVPDWYEEVAEESAKGSIQLQLGGIACMVIFIILALGNWTSPLESRAALALKGLGLVLISAVSSAGIVMLFGLQFNSVTLIVLPNLALGLGVNDMFVLLRSFSELGNPFIRTNDFSEVSSAIFADAGVGVLLTSLCNCVSLVACSITLRIAIIQDTCLTIAIVVVVNFLCMTTMFPYFICTEKNRVTRGNPEKLCCTFMCHRQSLANPSQVTESTGMSDAILQFVACIANPEKSNDSRHWFLRLCLPETTIPSVGRFIFKNGVLAASLGLVVFCLDNIQNKTIGYTFADLIPDHMVSYQKGVKAFDGTAQYITYMYFDNVDLPTRQAEIVELYFALMNSTCGGPTVTPWFSEFYSDHVFRVPGLLDPSYTHQGCMTCSPPIYPLAPYGIATSDRDFFYAQYRNWTTLPEDPIEAALSSYASAERCNADQFAMHDDGTIDLSFFTFLITKGGRTSDPVENVLSDSELVECIRVVRDIVGNSTLAGEAFPFGAFEFGGKFSMWEVFLSIDDALFVALGTTLGCIFVITWCVLGSLGSALSSTMAISFILVQVYGLFMLIATFNAFVVSGLVVAAGMAVEFTAHLVAQFSSEKGSAHDRMSAALFAVTTPILQGTASTFLAILPLAVSPIPFFIKYSFLLTSLSLGVGWFNGMVVLPAFLVTLANAGENIGLKKKESQQLPTDADADSVGQHPRTRRLSRDSRDGISMTAAEANYSVNESAQEDYPVAVGEATAVQAVEARVELTF